MTAKKKKKLVECYTRNFVRGTLPELEINRFHCTKLI